jgi:acetoin utilization deacetylase AcuC-like enzyme
MSAGLLVDPIYIQHETGRGHPESPQRYEAITEALTDAGLIGRTIPLCQKQATADEISLCHTDEYIELARKDVESGKSDLSTGDTAICRRSYEVAASAVGGVLNAVDAVMSGKMETAFCAVRPPGHHARPAQGMGFCLFNNIAIGARYAQKRYGAEKVLIVDWDVHHGNGTQDIFDEDPSVFFFSTHQSPWYPFTGHAEETGKNKGAGTTMNCPFPAGTGMAEIGGAIRQKLVPAMKSFGPDLIMISAGFDSRVDDPLGRFKLTDADFVTLTQLLRELAEEHCHGRLISALEGGYNLAGLSSAVVSHVKALL